MSTCNHILKPEQIIGGGIINQLVSFESFSVSKIFNYKGDNIMKKLLFVIVLISIFLFVNVASFSESEKVILNFIETLTNPDRTMFLKEIISDFEELHPNIQINLISPPYEQADQKATMMLNTNQPLDIIEVRDFTIKQFTNNEKLLNLESYLASWPDSKTLTANFWKAARTVDNTAYMAPHGFHIPALFYRTDILGINFVPPKTWVKLFEICKEITNPSKNQYGFDFRGKSWEMRFPDMVVSSFLDDILDENNMYMKTDGNLVFNDSRAVEGLKLYIRFFKETAPKDAINWGWNEQLNSFASGITPFLIANSTGINIIDTMIARDKYMTAPLPIGPSGKINLTAGFAGLGIASYSKYKKEAWEFIEYLSSPKVNANLCKKMGTFPIHSVTYKTDAFFDTGIYRAWAYMIEHPEEYVFTGYPYDSPKFPGWPAIHEVDMQSLLLEKVTIEEVVDRWTKYWQ